jgi:hypothetical protein
MSSSREIYRGDTRFRDDASAGRLLDKAKAQEVRLVDLFDCVLGLPNRSGNRFESKRA